MRICRIRNLIGLLLIIFTLFSITRVKDSTAKDKETVEIIDVQPKDAIQSIKDPKFVSSTEAKLHQDEPVIGLSINGDDRAYSIYLLNSHEIVNDVIESKPVAVTW